MKRTDLEHLLRAAGRVIKADRIIVVGSQAILATIPEFMLPPEATRSVEADLIPLDGTEALADQIDGAIGEGSMFHETFGVYAQGVRYETVHRTRRMARQTHRLLQRQHRRRHRTLPGDQRPLAHQTLRRPTEGLRVLPGTRPSAAHHPRHRPGAGTNDRPESRPDRTCNARRVSGG